MCSVIRFLILFHTVRQMILRVLRIIERLYSMSFSLVFHFLCFFPWIFVSSGIFIL